MPGTIRMARRASCSAPRGPISFEGSVQGWVLVRPLGRELRLRHKWRVALFRNHFIDRAGLLQAGCELAEGCAKAGRQFWRVAAQLSPRIFKRARPQHAFANRLGTDGPAR